MLLCDQSWDMQDSAEVGTECELKAETGAAAAARERLGWSPHPRVRSSETERPIGGGEPSGGQQQQVTCWCSALLVSSEVLDAACGYA